MPLGAVPPDQGSLLVAAGSHRLPAFAPLRNGYGQSQAPNSLMISRLPYDVYRVHC